MTRAALDRGTLHIKPGVRERSEGDPECVPVRQIRIGQFYLTQAKWYNSGPFGGYSRETGIRDLSHPGGCHGHGFTLVQHFDLSFDDALAEITWRLEAGHDPLEIERDVSELETQTPKARLL